MKTLRNAIDGNRSSNPFRGRVRLALFLVALLVQAISLCGSAWADEKLILVQKVKLTVVQDKPTWVGIGKGPFTDQYPNGLPFNAPQLAQSKIDPNDINEREFGSIGAANGSMIKNLTGKNVTQIQITTQGKTNGTDNTIDKKSSGGDEFETAINGKTITFTIKRGKVFKTDEFVWMKMPKGPQPGQPGAKIYKGKVTLEAPGMQLSPALAAPMPPAVGNNTGLSAIHYDSTTATLSFQPGSVTFATYTDGITVVTNGPNEDIIGSQIQIGDMQVLGPSSTVPGAFDLSDSGIALVQQDQTLLEGELINNLLVPDPSHPGLAVIQGTLTFDEGLPYGLSGGLASLLHSKYVQQYFGDSSGSAVFFQSNILSSTDQLAHDGDATGPLLIGSIAPASASAAAQ